MPDSPIYLPQTKKTHQVGSRLVAKEQKKLSQQTFIMIGASVLIILLFIFVIMPLVVRLFFQFIDGNSIGEPTDTVPPPVPVVQSPISATNSATLAITGMAEANSKVIFVLNGSKQSEVKVDTEGYFAYELNLEAGDNSLSLYSVDEAGNESIQTRNYTILYDNEPPLIEISYPQDGEEITLSRNQVIEIVGKTEPGSKVYINDRLSYPNSLGEFRSRYSLSEGENILHFKAIDRGGNQTELEIKVNFRF